ncbi:hypothetical protein, partial [Streptomyces anulatus]|uniref:hypothetical protein n=1 Tax=Streptomyces anulatus TaxID=1892 RepID=UPI0036B92D3F
QLDIALRGVECLPAALVGGRDSGTVGSVVGHDADQNCAGDGERAEEGEPLSHQAIIAPVLATVTMIGALVSMSRVSSAPEPGAGNR